MSYDASFVLGGVRRGQFARSVRPFLLEAGALTNVSFVVIPADAEHVAGAQVVANLLLSPELQAAKADPAILGHPTVLDRERLEAGSRDRFPACRLQSVRPVRLRGDARGAAGR